MLDVKDISFRYKKNVVLDNVSFNIKKGEVIGLLGVNGAGKSTLLKCLARLLTPQQGEITLHGQKLQSLERKKISKHICYVSQNSSDIGFSVFESILMGRRPHYQFFPRRKDLETVEELISLMGLNDLTNRDTGELSGGEYQKVVLARAFVQEPELLLLDEPTNHLDIKKQLEVMDLITHLVRVHKLTSIISLHDINMAFRYVDKIMLLKDRQIFFYDQKDNLTESVLKEVYDIELQLKNYNDYKIFVPLY